jgi:hypothetical protein
MKRTSGAKLVSSLSFESVINEKDLWSKTCELSLFEVSSMNRTSVAKLVSSLSLGSVINE